MRKLALSMAALLAPSGAFAADGPSLAGSVLQTVASLILVIGIILILCYLAGRFLKIPQRSGSGYIRVVETKYLAPKKSLMLVEVGGEYLLLGNSAEGISLIKQVEMLEEIEVMPEKDYAALLPTQLKEKLKALARELPAGSRRLSQLKKSGEFA
jgi:flagellar protein FliO/FliZ